MKDGVLLYKEKEVTETKFREVYKKISRNYWFGWAGGYGNPKKK